MQCVINNNMEKNNVEKIEQPKIRIINTRIDWIRIIIILTFIELA